MINAVWRNKSLQFLPSYERIKDLIISIYDVIEELPFNLKRIEYHIHEKYHTTRLLEVKILHIYLFFFFYNINKQSVKCYLQ